MARLEAAVAIGHIQKRAGRWCIVDLVGKHGRVRTGPHLRQQWHNAIHRRVDWQNAGGGDILVAFLVFLVGVLLQLAHADVGKEIVVGALAALWTSLRKVKRESAP